MPCALTWKLLMLNHVFHRPKISLNGDHKFVPFMNKLWHEGWLKTVFQTRQDWTTPAHVGEKQQHNCTMPPTLSKLYLISLLTLLKSTERKPVCFQQSVPPSVLIESHRGFNIVFDEAKAAVWFHLFAGPLNLRLPLHGDIAAISDHGYNRILYFDLC